MISIEKFKHLHGRSRTRKAALVLERVEREYASNRADGIGQNADSRLGESVSESLEYLRQLVDFLGADSESPKALAQEAARFLDRTGPENSGNFKGVLRAINDFRHACMAISGQACADWDFLDLDGRRSLSGALKVAGEPDSIQGRDSVGRAFAGLAVYLEAVRSPFNVGTIIRTAEAFGFGEVILSPECADPQHPRAARSSMGAVDMIPWRREGLDVLRGSRSSFALELGGKPLDEFEFPRSGIIVVGSEELGVSTDAISLCSDGVLSIPMRGRKASINVAVAFGIAANAWISKISD